MVDDGSQKLHYFFTIMVKQVTDNFFSLSHLGLEHVHGSADVGVHPVPLEAHVDSLLEGQAQGASIDEAEEHTDQLNKQNASNTDAILQISSHSGL